MKTHLTIVRFHFAAMFAILLMSVTPSWAQLKTVTLTNTPGQELSGGVIYVVNSNLVINPNSSGKYTGQTGLTIGTGATVTIYIAKDCTLEVHGSDGSLDKPGMAGIYVPYGSTLIITGEGKLTAYGGNAGAGGNGSRGGAAWLHWRNNNGAGGQGGRGGNGGGGAAAGIGGNGGTGAFAQEGPLGLTRNCDGNDFDGSGVGGNSATEGAWGYDMGTVYVLGTVNVTAVPGTCDGVVGGSAGSGYGDRATDSGSGWVNNYTSSGGGPGGGGGSGYSAKSGIGGGARGGQSGSTGGSGGTMKNSSGRSDISGGYGLGGYGGKPGAAATWCYAKSDYGKSGGAGGRRDSYSGDGKSVSTYGNNTNGGEGMLYIQDNASVSKSYLVRSASATASVTTVPSAIRCVYSFDANGGTTKQTQSYVYYGIRPIRLTSLPENQPKVFAGYYTEKEGGTMVYDQGGNATDIFIGTADQVLYAHWYDGYIQTQGDAYFKTNCVYGDGMKIERLAEDNQMYEETTRLDDGTMYIKGGIKNAQIVKGDVVLHSYLPAKRSGNVCLFDETTRSYLYISSGGTVLDKRSACVHALSGGRSAYHTIGTAQDGDTNYDVKQCYLCEAQERVVTDNNYVSFNGESWFDTGYKPTDNTEIYVKAQYDLTPVVVEKETAMGNSSNNFVPMSNYYNKTTTASVYPASTLNQKGLITSISYYVDRYALISTGLKIYMGYFEGLISGSTDYSKIENLQLVYSGNVTIGKNDGWETYQLDIPFNWDCHKNLAVVVCRDATTNNYNLQYRVHSGNGCGNSLYRRSDSDTSCGDVSNTQNFNVISNIPDIKVTIQAAQPHPYALFGAKDRVNSYEFKLDGASESSAKCCASSGNTYESRSSANDAYDMTDYDILLENGQLQINESDLPTTTTTSLTWTKAPVKTDLPLYIGATDSLGHTINCFKGKVYSFAIMEKGQTVHRFVPARFNDKVGFYDEITDQFSALGGSGAAAAVSESRCTHYCEVNRNDGIELRHCMVCDKKLDTRYYINIQYDNGGESGVDGVMQPQTIDVCGRLSSAVYTKPMRKMIGWSTTKGGAVSYSDQQALTCSETLKGKMKLYGIWRDCYAVRGDTTAIPDDGVVDSICIKENEKLRYGFSTVSPITVKNFAYVRALPEGTRWGTLCLPIQVKSDADITYYNISRIEGGKMILSRQDAVAANTPCIFRVNNAEMDTIKYSSQNVRYDGSIITPTSTAGMHLVGTYDYQQMNMEGDSCYAISGNIFYKVKSSLDLSPFHAYVAVDKASAGARQELILVDETETGIDDIWSTDGQNAPDGKYLEGNRIVILQGGRKYNVDGTRR